MKPDKVVIIYADKKKNKVLEIWINDMLIWENHKDSEYK